MEEIKHIGIQPTDGAEAAQGHNTEWPPGYMYLQASVTMY